MACQPDRRCTDCGSYHFVEDRAQGDLVCTGCGLVAEERMMDETSEWRTFSDQDRAGGVDPNRVGGPSNPLLSGGGLASTVIGKATGDGGLSSKLQRVQQRSGGASSGADRSLTDAWRVIERICGNLHLSPAVKDRACTHYAHVKSTKKVRGRTTEALCGACVFLACRLERNPRTVKEIMGVLPVATAIDIQRAFKRIQALIRDDDVQVPGSAATTSPHPEQHMKKLCKALNLPVPFLELCREMAYLVKPTGSDCGRALKPWDARRPESIAAAIVFVITNLSKDVTQRVSMAHVVTATQVAEGTVRTVYREMYPQLAQLLPQGYASAEQLASLPMPRGTVGSGGSGGN